MLTAAETRTDPSALLGPDPQDELVHLREWGSDRTYAFPDHAGDWTIGSSARCWLQLHDEPRRVSRHHARLSHGPTGWVIQDDQSKNGLWRDGERQVAFALWPGVVVGIGGVQLIAESRRSIRTRTLLQRWLGWAPERAHDVDRGLQIVRTLATARVHLALCGAGNLVALAQHLHRLTVGSARPFVICDPGRRSVRAMTGAVESHPLGVDAMRAAPAGTVCVSAARLPTDFSTMATQLREPTNRTRLIVCAPAIDRLAMSEALVVPPLASRTDEEIVRIVDAYAADALANLGADPAAFTDRDRAWILERAPTTLAEIEVATLRLSAIRAFGGVTRAAPRLGITHAALSRWIGRRLPRAPRTDG